MNPVVVSDLSRFTDGETQGISAMVTVAGTSHDIWYRVRGGQVADGAETLLAATLVPAMRVGGGLHIEGAVSARLLHTVPRIQEIFHAWYPMLTQIPVRVSPRPPGPSVTPRGVACFFSGGVDSFYTFLKARDEITTMIFVHGFDIRLDRVALRDKVAGAVRDIAAKLHRPLIEVETNLRDFSNRYARWAPEYFGAALASVGLLLSPQFRRIYIPGSVTYAELLPWGSHPMVDTLWRTEETELVHDGCEATRVQKVAFVAGHEVALQSLRVCWENRNGAYNCGRCEKCLRTMISLRAVGALDRCPTFPRRLSLPAVATVAIPNAILRSFYEQNLDVVLRSGHDPALAWALRICLNRYRQGLWYLARGARNRARRYASRLMPQASRRLGLVP